jgi:hypothetical protein
MLKCPTMVFEQKFHQYFGLFLIALEMSEIILIFNFWADVPKLFVDVISEFSK